jgi:hypothetical protein
VIVLVSRGRHVYDNCRPFLKDKGKRIKDKNWIAGILAIWPIPDKEFVHPSA